LLPPFLSPSLFLPILWRLPLSLPSLIPLFLLSSVSCSFRAGVQL
jgi:hypothetical protein